MCRVHFFCVLAAALSCGAAAETLTRERIETDWLRQDEVRGIPVPGGPVTVEEDAAGGCDGVREGSFGFHTAREDQPWWQVDLKRSWPLDQVLVYNRCDEHSERAARLIVLVSDDAKKWQEVYRHDGTVFYGYRDARPLSVKLPEVKARYVRIQLPERDACLHLDEVEIYPVNNHRNLALAMPATQSSVSKLSRRIRPQLLKPEQFSVGHVVERGLQLAESLRRLGVAVDAEVNELRQVGKEPNRELYFRVRWTVRQLALRNPLLNFDRVLFVQRESARFKTSAKSSWYTHMSDQYYGWFTRPGGGLYLLEGFKTVQPIVRCLTPSFEPGTIVRPELSYDAKKVLFAYSKHYPGLIDLPDKLDKSRISEDAFFQLYEMRLDGSGLRQLTHGKYDNFDGHYLPNGEIVFLSTRRGEDPQYTKVAARQPRAGRCDSYVRCGGDEFRPVAVYTLHVMDADGGRIRPISPFEMFEWEPSVDHEGRIIYSRWDYVDREAMPYMSLWATFPDGTGTQAIFGNYTLNPHCMFEPRAVPGSRKFVFTASAHHANTAGSLVLLDPRKGTDGNAPMTRLTPEVPFPEIEAWPDTYYANPYPLSEEHYLTAWSDQPLRQTGHEVGAAAMGIYLFDAFGNLNLLWRDAKLSCMYPIPVRPRAVPPQLAATTAWDGSQTGRMVVLDVYRGLESVSQGTIRSLRLVGVPPKNHPRMNRPVMGLTGHDPGKFVLGTVSVEADGSAYFEAPSGVPFFLQALDADGMAVQTMRSATYLQPGQQTSCVGCHEHRHTAPPSRAPLALRRAPSRLQPGPDGSWPLNYQTLVQPVLDKHCVQCHQPGAKGAKFDLTPAKSYQSLANHGAPSLKTHVVTYHRQGRSSPGTGPSRESALLRQLRQGHNKVLLSSDDWNRLITWMDTYGQQFGSFSPAQEQQLIELRQSMATVLAK
jgi:mono/diheme cytochrome c family protein